MGNIDIYLHICLNLSGLEQGEKSKMSCHDLPAFQESAARILLGIGLDDEFTHVELKRALGLAARQYGTKRTPTERFPRDILEQNSSYLHKAYTTLAPLAVDGEPFKQGLHPMPETMVERPGEERPLKDFLWSFD